MDLDFARRLGHLPLSLSLAPPPSVSKGSLTSRLENWLENSWPSKKVSEDTNIEALGPQQSREGWKLTSCFSPPGSQLRLVESIYIYIYAKYSGLLLTNPNPTGSQKRKNLESIECIYTVRTKTRSSYRIACAFSPSPFSLWLNQWQKTDRLIHQS